jgi:hypothetical protein
MNHVTLLNIRDVMKEKLWPQFGFANHLVLIMC